MSIDLETYDRLTPATTIGPYRRGDYMSLADDERCELLHGRLYLLPSPGLIHQRIVALLAHSFVESARRSRGMAFVAPFDVVLADHSIVQPDVIYVAPTATCKLARTIEGPPSLVVEVEVESEGSDRRDRIEKPPLYARSGIPEFWRIDPFARTIEFMVNVNGRWQIEFPDGASYRSRLFPEVEIDLDRFWGEIGESGAE